MELGKLTQQMEWALATLLGHRFGDGLVYVQSQADRATLARARRLGLVDSEGYLTNAGRRFWNRRADRT